MCKSCYGCEKRVAPSEYNCHSDCPDYNKDRDEKVERARLIRQKRNEDAAVTDVRIRSIKKTARDKNRQSAWKG